MFRRTKQTEVKMANSELVQSVAKALDILQYVASQHSGIRLNELAAHFGMKPTTVHNILRTLRSRGFLEKDSCSRFRIGPAFLAVAACRQSDGIMSGAEDQLKKLASAYPEAVITFSEMTESVVACRRRVSPDRPGEVQIPINRTFPPYSTVTGIAMIIFGGTDPEIIEQRWPFSEFGLPFWKSRAEFDSAAEQFRSSGYADRIVEDRYFIAVPVAENFALGFNGPADTKAERSAIAKAMISAVSEINDGAAAK